MGDHRGGRHAALTLVWTELGGPAVDPPTDRGFGSRMIEEVLANQISGTVRMDFHPTGVTCSMSISTGANAEL